MTNEQRKLLSDWRDALRHLETMNWQERGFSMLFWAKGKKPESPELGCGTVCCAYGLGTTLPSWRKAGIILQEYTLCGTKRYWNVMNGAAKKLGITDLDFSNITNTSSEKAKTVVSPGVVANRIQKVLDSRKF